MKLFGWLKKLFNRSININDISNDCLIALCKDNASIKIGTTLEVKQGFVAVIVARGKVCDTFVEGKYRLEPKQMPLLSRVLKLTHTNKKGDMPNKFRADIYYVNLKQFDDGMFDSYDFVTATGQKYKKVKVGISGNFAYQICSPVDFMEAMLTQYGLIKEKIAKEEIGYWLSKVVVRKVQKNKPEIEELYERATKCFDGIVEYANKELYDCGIKILKIDISDTKFPKKIYKNVTLSYDELHQKPIKQQQAELDVGANPVKNAEQSAFQNQSNDVYIEQSKQIESSTQTNVLIANGNGTTEILPQQETFEEQKLDSENLANNNVYNDAKIDNGEIIAQQETIASDSTEKAEPVDAPVQKTVQYKKCSKCGAFNPVDSDICFSCKNKLD